MPTRRALAEQLMGFSMRYRLPVDMVRSPRNAPRIYASIASRGFNLWPERPTPCDGKTASRNVPDTTFDTTGHIWQDRHRSKT